MVKDETVPGGIEGDLEKGGGRKRRSL